MSLPSSLWMLAAGTADAAGETAEPLGDYSATQGLVQVVIFLVAICLLFWVLIRWILPRLARAAGGRGLRLGGGGRVLRVVDRCPLDPKRTLFVVEVAGRYLLLGSAEGSITRLGGEDLDEVELRRRLGEPPARPFAGLLNVVGGRKSETKTAE